MDILIINFYWLNVIYIFCIKVGAATYLYIFSICTLINSGPFLSKITENYCFAPVTHITQWDLYSWICAAILRILSFAFTILLLVRYADKHWISLEYRMNTLNTLFLGCDLYLCPHSSSAQGVKGNLYDEGIGSSKYRDSNPSHSIHH